MGREDCCPRTVEENVCSFEGNDIQIFFSIGDSLTARHNGEDFSTIDRDNDDMADFHLANTTAGPWWYGVTADSSLNANYDKGIIRWLSLPGFHGRIRFVEMKVRPV
ncbi:Ryncolin-4 [Holothuria leucospilota]|uniref:Ryncolin-4 n=1 Tax=Holothuria leucospilota TaxID=206669 RepID=A0A9Q1BWL9_HOLLE|nr:Ryncolin-4 [Holothuria leucospilota]